MIKISVLMVVCAILAYYSEMQTQTIQRSGDRYSVWSDPAYIGLVFVLALFSGLRTEYNDSPLSSKRQKIFV